MIRKTVIFLDNTYPTPYQVSTLDEHAIGGTESSIVKTAVILSKIYNVFVAQKSRKQANQESEYLKFIAKDEMYVIKADFIIVLRKYPLLKKLKERFPKAKLYLWIHTYKNNEYIFKRSGLAKTNTTIICNSKTHSNDIDRLLNKTFLGKLWSVFTKQTKVTYCYNPVSKAIDIDSKRDNNKLLFFSSPNKGLTQIIKTFNEINKKLPDLRLYIANPGYKADIEIEQNSNIIILGSLPRIEMMDHVSQSLCVFYPQDSFAETFGLIYAEANSYGTPVLAHDIGSAREILDVNNVLIDATITNEIIATIKSWQINFPKVSYNTRLSDIKILEQWHSLLS